MISYASPKFAKKISKTFGAQPSPVKISMRRSMMERVDSQGNVIGFSILGVTRFKKDKPLEAELTAA